MVMDMIYVSKGKALLILLPRRKKIVVICTKAPVFDDDIDRDFLLQRTAFRIYLDFGP